MGTIIDIAFVAALVYSWYKGWIITNFPWQQDDTDRND